ncbi:MAG: hypothetical protein DBO99_13035 [gamma proteobacterium symbiont of Ctena orbiculata]|nr:MAG: hypothetical protein DBO99_13035 [gamma proteobacterium symbiont of Ctena orbiculata]
MILNPMSNLEIFTVAVGLVIALNLVLAIKRWVKFHGTDSPAKEIGDSSQKSLYAANTQKLKVMVVDDSATVRKVVSRLLTKHGYDVLAEPNGEAALTDLVEFSPDLVFLDIEMPQMDGYELAKRITSSQGTRPIPIVMLSSSSDSARQHKSTSELPVISGSDSQSILKTAREYLPAS